VKTITWRLAILWMVIPAVEMLALQNHPHAHNQSAAAGPAWSSAAESMEKMHAAMAAVAPSGDSDADFASLMLPHHQGAIDMARTELQYGKNPQMRRLAQEIVADQQSEIELMQLWLKQRGPNSSQEKPAAIIRAGQER